MSRDLEEGRSPHERPNFMKIMKIMKFSILEALGPDLKRIPLGGLRCRAMFKWLVEHLSFKRCSLRVIRVQGELVGHFWETDLLVSFMTSFSDYEKFTSLFWLRIIFPWTLIYKESTGASLMSVASLCLEFCAREVSLMRDQILWKSWKSWNS